MEVCEITELPRATCAHCRPAKADDQPLRTGPTITASFGSSCSCCGDGIEEGDEIVYSDEAGGWCLLAHTREPTRRTWSPKKT